MLLLLALLGVALRATTLPEDLEVLETRERAASLATLEEYLARLEAAHPTGKTALMRQLVAQERTQHHPAALGRLAQLVRAHIHQRRVVVRELLGRPIGDGRWTYESAVALGCFYLADALRGQRGARQFDRAVANYRAASEAGWSGGEKRAALEALIELGRRVKIT